MSEKPTVNVNMGALGSPMFLLFLVFMILKLCDKIDWSWAWVTAPLWIPFGIFGVIMVFFLMMAVVAKLLE